MTYDQIFQFSNTFVLLGWFLLVIAPRWKWTSRIVIGLVAALLSALYVSQVFQVFSADDFSNFGSLKGVMALFTQEGAVLAGWIHYLAFDLMVGWFIVGNSVKYQINHFIIIPCLLLTFMLGPTGLLLYLLIRFAFSKNYFVDWEG